MRRACDWVAWPVLAGALLLVFNHAYAIEMIAPGICPSIDIRNNPEHMKKLQDCRVIEGYLNIVLMERATHTSFENYSFPKLREVTGYILIYRLRGVRNLGDLFPNLSVIRGLQLFKDYALVIFDNEGLESLGLRSLTRIERGAVRIQNNDRLCYANTIDWSKIVADGSNNIIRSNYDTRLCGLCPNAQSRVEDHRQQHLQCPADSSGRLLCWDDKHCQKRDCPSSCGGRACVGNGTCCHVTCLGGCDGPLPSDCHVCANFSFRYGSERTCMERCPANTYQLARRCVTEQECRSMPIPQALDGRTQPNIKAYKILHNNKCVYMCPSGYMETGEAHNSRCEPCPASGCKRDCEGGKIDSVASAEKFRGCTHIRGVLEIALRASGGNTMTVLENSLGEIREIDVALRIVRSYPLVSLMFLKNLERIGGRGTDNTGQSLYIFNNPNLELLWDWSSGKKIEIISGRLFIHFNPKLCYNQIEKLKNMTRDPMTTFNDLTVSKDNNGDQASCFQDTLHLKVHSLVNRVAILTWDMYCSEDSRKLIGYSIYYIQAQHNVTLYGQRDACSDTWNVLDITMDEVRNTTKPMPTNRSTKVLPNPCEDIQPLFYPLTQLQHYTRYAAYVKTYTTRDRKGAQSPIIYFTTMPGHPSPPRGLTVENLREHSATIKWQSPAMPNGTIESYRIEIQANAYNQHKILADNLNYCTNPSALVNMIAVRGEEVAEKKEDKTTGDVKSETCACKEDNKPAVRFNSEAEEERVESIDFENELQNHVYVKQGTRTGTSTAASRMRRSIDNSVNSMLVILSDIHAPRLGYNYTNETDGGYVKSMYFELGGKAKSLTVENLRHFTWYTVNIWACRKKHPNETLDDYNESWCSVRAYYNFRTLEQLNADFVRNVRADIVPSNKTLPEVNVTWLPPEDPNGFVVAYNVYHSRVEDGEQSADVGLTSCIRADDYESNGRSFIIRTLLAGNYSIRVTPLTVSGVGNVSAEIYVNIPEVRPEGGYEWVWGVVGGCAVVVCAAALGAWYARRALHTHDNNKLFARVNPEYVSTVYVPDEWEVPRASIEFVRELGQGSFGMVYEGIAKNIEKGKPETRCAVKTVNEHATDRERIEFLNEASVMKAFDTFHVVRLLGVVSRGQPTLVVMELMEQGDLKTYLRSHRPDADSSLPKKGPAPCPPTLQNILQMAIEIADGMAYLSAKKFVHRDLAARNCMVAGDLTVKVGDFGMTRDIYETDYYRKGTKGLLPVRWMSPESLKDGVFSSNTDVWSYGVVLWEMATLAMQPYQGLSNEQVVRYVIEGGVMERPEHCPDRLYELMRECWAHRPGARPSFLQLVAELLPTAQPYFRHRSFFHTPQGQEMYALQRTAAEEEQEMQEVNVGAVATGSGSNLFGVSGRLASWVRELSSLRSRTSDDAAAEPLQPLQPPDLHPRKPPPNGNLPPPC